MLDHAIQTAQEQMQDGATDAALNTLAEALEQDPKAPAVYRAASQMLIKLGTTPDVLTNWDGFDGLVRQLLHHTPCSDPMAIFAHEAASAITSDNLQAIKGLLSTLSKILPEELGKDGPGQKNVLLFALVTRNFVGPWLDQTSLSQLHLEHFESFTKQDRALPYSVMFCPEYFGANRDDLVQTYCTEGDTNRLYDLSPDQVLFFSWLTQRAAFPEATALLSYLDTQSLENPDARAGARALLLHHRANPSPDQLAAWGMSDFGETLASCHARSEFKTTPGKTANLYNKAYQIRNAFTYKVAPFLANRSKLKVAICLSGQLRGYRKALATWKQALLPFIEPVFFVHSWENIGRADAQPFRYVLPFAGSTFPETYREIATTSGYTHMKEQYPALFKALTSGSVTSPAPLRDAYKTDHVILEDDKDPKFDSFTNQHKMHYKIHAADRLAREHIGDDVDLYLRLRPDLSISMLGFSWRDLLDACRAKPLIFAEKPYGMHYGNLMCGDQCAIATPEVMQIYANTWETFPALAQSNIAHCPEDFEGHASLAMTAWTNGVTVKRLPVRFGVLQEAAPLSTQDIIATLEKDSRGNAEDIRLLDAARKDASAN